MTLSPPVAPMRVRHSESETQSQRHSVLAHGVCRGPPNISSNNLAFDVLAQYRVCSAGVLEQPEPFLRAHSIYLKAV